MQGKIIGLHHQRDHRSAHVKRHRVQHPRRPCRRRYQRSHVRANLRAQSGDPFQREHATDVQDDSNRAICVRRDGQLGGRRCQLVASNFGKTHARSDTLSVPSDTVLLLEIRFLL